jgi:hypothetical protein
VSGYVAQLRAWPRRRWVVAAATTALYALLVAVPTDLVDTPLFWREVPPTWWSWPALLLSSALAGVLTASYVAADAVPVDDERPRRGGLVGGLLTYFAVGCPVCNKLVLLALGSAGAMTWFEPFQPVLQVAALAVLLWALRARLRGEISCRLLPTVSETP